MVTVFCSTFFHSPALAAMLETVFWSSYRYVSIAISYKVFQLLPSLVQSAYFYRANFPSSTVTLTTQIYLISVTCCNLSLDFITF